MPVSHIHFDPSSVSCLGPMADFRTYNWWRGIYPQFHQRAPQDWRTAVECVHIKMSQDPAKGWPPRVLTGQMLVVMSLWLDFRREGILLQLLQHGVKVTVMEYARDLWIYKTEVTYHTVIILDQTKVLKLWYHAPKVCTALYKGMPSGHTRKSEYVCATFRSELFLGAFTMSSLRVPCDLFTHAWNICTTTGWIC
jgi:hypothetical protein